MTVLLAGITGPVDEMNYEGIMISMASFDDGWIADVASYVRNSFNNSASMITSNQVARLRKQLGEVGNSFTIPEVLSMLPVALTNQANWKVTASHNSEKAADAVNGVSAGKSWSSETKQAEAMWFQVELPEPITFWELSLNAPAPAAGTPASSPQAYKVQTSMNGSDWSKSLADGNGRNPTTVIGVDPTQAKFVRVTLTSPATNSAPWAINRVQIFPSSGAVPVASSAPRVNRFD